MRTTCTNIRHLLLAVALALPLAACGGGTTTDNSTTDSSSGDTSDGVEPTSEVEHTGQPRPEGTGPESARPPQRGDGSVTLPSLPVGYNVDNSDPARQCLTVNWAQNSEVLELVPVTVTTVRVTPDGVFTRTGSGCGGIPTCTSFKFTGSGSACSISLTAKAAGGRTAVVSMQGKAQCPKDRQQVCQKIKDSKQATVTVTQPAKAATTSSTTTKTTTTTG